MVNALLFGLSADPVHIGHTQVLEAACHWLQKQQRCPSRALIVPVGKVNPVNGKTAARAAFNQRLTMCQLAFECLPLPCPLQVLDTEWQQLRGGLTHNTTWDTLNVLENTLLWREGITMLLSADHFSGDKPAFFRWYRWRNLLTRADWLIATRPGHVIQTDTWNVLSTVTQAAGRQIHLLDAPMPDVASSQLRQWLAAGTKKSIKKAEPFLPETVSAYIQRNALYGAASSC